MRSSNQRLRDTDRFDEEVVKWPGVVTNTALNYIQAPEEKRAHLVRRDSIRELGNGLLEGVTLCGKRIVGYPSRDPRPALCQHCVLAKLKSM